MRRDFQRFPEISQRFRGISRQVYEISVSDGPLDYAEGLHFSAFHLVKELWWKQVSQLYMYH